MSQISRDEVAHLARLARLALTDDELDSFAGQLDAILGHVSQIQAVDVTGVEPTGNPLKDVNVFRPDVVEPCLTQERRWRRRRKRPTAGSPSRGSWGRPNERDERLRKTDGVNDPARRGRRWAPRSPPRRCRRPRSTRACLDQIAETDDEYHAFLHVAEEQALADGRPGGRRRGRR